MHILQDRFEFITSDSDQPDQDSTLVVDDAESTATAMLSGWDRSSFTFGGKVQRLSGNGDGRHMEAGVPETAVEGMFVEDAPGFKQIGERRFYPGFEPGHVFVPDAQVSEFFSNNQMHPKFAERRIRAAIQAMVDPEDSSTQLWHAFYHQAREIMSSEEEMRVASTGIAGAGMESLRRVKSRTSMRYRPTARRKPPEATNQLSIQDDTMSEAGWSEAGWGEEDRRYEQGPYPPRRDSLYRQQ